MVADGAAVMVTLAVDDETQPPVPEAVLVTVYVPGVLELKAIAPVELLSERPEGVAENVPAVAPLFKVIEAVPPFEQ